MSRTVSISGPGRLSLVSETVTQFIGMNGEVICAGFAKVPGDGANPGVRPRVAFAQEEPRVELL